MKIVKLIIGLLFATDVLFALFSIRLTNYGQWESYLTNWGKYGQSPSDLAGAWWPRGSGHNYIYGSGMWYGSIAPNGDTLVTIGYGPHGGESEFGPGAPHASVYDPYWHVYFSMDGDYPFTPVSFEDGYAVYNDFDPNYHMLGDGRPMGITITQWSYVWPRDWADDILFLRYIIKNDTNYTINNIYAGFCMDYDIGNESGFGNDRGGCDVANKLFYGWQEQPEPGWSDRGMLGLKLLSAQPLTAYKRFTLSLEPNLDWQRYMTLAGYNFNTGAYEPFDTVWPPPDDQRCLMATGSFNLPAGDSVIIDWAFIGGHDSMPPAVDLNYKADKAQTMYNTGLHTVHVTDPNGGEVVSQIYPIHYSATSITPNPLQADIYFFSENFMDTLAWGVNASGIYDWNSTGVPDCVLGRIGILAFDSITFGYDRTDGYFIVDNPGNSPPYLRILAPADGDTLVRDVVITWFARDPEYYDSLPIDIYYKNNCDSTPQVIASGEVNDSAFVWNTLPCRNGPGLLMVETHDELFTVAETIPVILSNQISGGPVEHIAGLNNTVNLSVLVHQPANLTGHTYEIDFTKYRALHPDNNYYPGYAYTVIDSNTGQIKLQNYSMAGGYEFNTIRLSIDDFSPIVDGFSIRAWTMADTIISLNHFHNDSVRVISGSYPADSIRLVMGPLSNGWWAYRGSRIRLDWFQKPTGGLSLMPVDMDYGDTIPYEPYGSVLNPDSSFGWCFQLSPSGYSPSETLRVNDRYIFLCGDRIIFSRIVPPPLPGDQWVVYPKTYAPPIKGNIYRFHPVNSVAENKIGIKPFLFQVYPVPASRHLTVKYSLPKRQVVKVAIYDVLGRNVNVIKEGVENSGEYRLIWDGLDLNRRRVSAGVYFCRLEAADFTATRKFILTR